MAIKHTESLWFSQNAQNSHHCIVFLSKALRDQVQVQAHANQAFLSLHL